MPQYHLPGAGRIADPFMRAYVAMMFFCETDESPDCPEEYRRSLRYGAGVSNLTRASLAAIAADCERFKGLAGDLIDERGPEQAGHDFWLTREGHGSGFWDCGRWPENGDRLTEIAKSFGEVSGAGYLCQVGRWVHYTA